MHLHQMEYERFPVVDPWKAYVLKIGAVAILILLLLCSGFGKEYPDVCHVSLHLIIILIHKLH
jgi:hypothetical protein